MVNGVTTKIITDPISYTFQNFFIRKTLIKLQFGPEILTILRLQLCCDRIPEKQAVKCHAKMRFMSERHKEFKDHRMVIHRPPVVIGYRAHLCHMTLEIVPFNESTKSFVDTKSLAVGGT